MQPGRTAVLHPFFKYNVTDMGRQLEVEAGFAFAAPVTGQDRVLAGVGPAGRPAGTTTNLAGICTLAFKLAG